MAMTFQEALPGLIAASFVASGVVLGLIVVVLRQRTRPRRIEGNQEEAASPDERMRDLEALADRLERLAARIERDLARQMQETRSLLTETERRTARLRELLDGHEPGSYESSEETRRKAEVVRLSRQGLDPVEIARRMRLDVGEVELLVRLQNCSPRG